MAPKISIRGGAKYGQATMGRAWGAVMGVRSIAWAERLAIACIVCHSLQLSSKCAATFQKLGSYAKVEGPPAKSGAEPPAANDFGGVSCAILCDFTHFSAFSSRLEI